MKPTRNIPYRPISCSFVDWIEHFATLGETVELVYFELNSNSEIVVYTKLSTWTNEGGIEFLVIEDGLKIRLDHIIRINDQELVGKEESCKT